MAKKRPGRKVRVDFRSNRLKPRRGGDLTGAYRRDADRVSDTHTSESVRAKGDLSRKRTIKVDENEAPLVDQAQWLAGVVTAVLGLVCKIDDATGLGWDCTVRRVLRTRLIEHRAPVTVGDRVWFSDQSAAGASGRVGVIERVAPRQTLLSRRVSTGHDQRRIRAVGEQKPMRIGRQHVIVANADQLLIVGSLAQPFLKPHLLDRYIVAALKGRLRPLICLNKIDLGSVDDRIDPDEQLAAAGLDSVAEVVAEYRALGYPCVYTSAVSGVGIQELRTALAGHSSVLSGQSGVGKSSLINALQPGLNLAVAEVSAENEKGRHTTTHARLIRLESGGYLVDTPGIRAFDLWDVQPGELEALFEEFVPLVPQCRFNDCTHRNEDGCAIRAAVEAGRLSPRRYDSYVKMFGEV